RASRENCRNGRSVDSSLTLADGVPIIPAPPWQVVRWAQSAAVNPDDKIIQCVDCGVEFVFTAGEQAFYREHGLTNVPTRCRACREARKAQKPARPPGSRRRETARPPGEARAMHPAICAGCGATTEIPFLPTAGRPVYCRDCFANRRAGEGEARSGVRRGPRP